MIQTQTHEDGQISMTSDAFTEAQHKDPRLRDLWKRADEGENNDAVENGLLFKRGKSCHNDAQDLEVRQLMVPVEYRAEVMRLAHDSLWAGHTCRGVGATKSRIRKSFTCSNMTMDIQAYVQSCPECQKTAVIKKADRAPLIEVPIIDKVFDTLEIDVLRPLSLKSSSGKQFVLIIVEQTTYWPEFIPLSSVTAKSVAKALIEVFARTGIPGVIKSMNIFVGGTPI